MKDPLKRYIILAVLIILLFMTGCGLKETTLGELYKGDLSDITKIRVVDGNTGYDVITTDQKQIFDFLNDLKHITFIPEENQEKRDGFMYSISFFENGDVTFQFELSEINGHYYRTEPAMYPIVNEFYMMLEEKE